MDELSNDDARRLFLHAQGLLGRPDRRAGAPGLLRRLGAVQLDTISVLARSHELVAYARLGAVGREAVETALWSGDAFEYWAHAASVLPLEDWPLFAFRRREHRASRRWGERAPAEALAAVRARLAVGPVTSSELGGARTGGGWGSRTALKVAVEDLLDFGEVACVTRRSWQRVYDLAERVVAPELLADERDDAACRTALVARAGRHLAVATARDLADYFRLRTADVQAVLAESGLVPVQVEGWRDPAFADPEALAALADGRVRGRQRTTLLSPFDSVVWDRARTARVFAFEHRLEAYVPQERRVHGYFVMPLLHRGRIEGRADVRRSGTTLVAHRVSLARGAVPGMGAALREAAEWVGCDAVAVERVEPPELATPLDVALE